MNRTSAKPITCTTKLIGILWNDNDRSLWSLTAMFHIRQCRVSLVDEWRAHGRVPSVRFYIKALPGVGHLTHSPTRTRFHLTDYFLQLTSLHLSWLSTAVSRHFHSKSFPKSSSSPILSSLQAFLSVIKTPYTRTTVIRSPSLGYAANGVLLSSIYPACGRISTSWTREISSEETICASSRL